MRGKLECGQSWLQCVLQQLLVQCCVQRSHQHTERHVYWTIRSRPSQININYYYSLITLTDYYWFELKSRSELLPEKYVAVLVNRCQLSCADQDPNLGVVLVSLLLIENTSCCLYWLSPFNRISLSRPNFTLAMFIPVSIQIRFDCAEVLFQLGLFLYMLHLIEFSTIPTKWTYSMLYGQIHHMVSLEDEKNKQGEGWSARWTWSYLITGLHMCK